MIERIPNSPPPIAPVADADERPLWSIMIPTYNCSKYLKQTIESVLIQDTGAGNMQIEVVDDCSTDADIALLVKEIGKGRVSFFRQQQNGGSLRNFETCLNRSRGHLIHLLHGDDQVKPGFYSEIENLFNLYPTAGAAVTGFSGVNENGAFLYTNNLLQNKPGILENWLIKIAEDQRLQACAVVVKRQVYEELGGFFGVEYGEDWEMWARIASRFPVAYSPETLALYRLHSDNISAKFVSNGKNIRDLRKVIETIQQYLPVEKRVAVKKTAKKNFANYYAGKAHGIYRKSGNSKLALKQAQGAVALDFNKKTVTILLKLYMKALFNYRTKQ